MEMRSYALQSVKDQYEKYPYPRYQSTDALLTASWLKKHGLQSKTVIDIGCGTGLWSIAFALNGSSVTAVDFSTASLTYAYKMALALSVSETFKIAGLLRFEHSVRFLFVV